MLQNYQIKDQKIKEAFLEMKKNNPEKFAKRLTMSWSNWGFGLEKLEDSVKRLKDAGLNYIELHGNHYGPDLGYKVPETKKVLEAYGVKTSGVCGMFSAQCDLSSNTPIERQRAVDYLKREIEFTAEMGGTYLLVVPAAVGRPNKYDDSEFERSVETVLLVADMFTQYGVQAAIEPIRSAETSLTHSFADAKRYIKAVNHRALATLTATCTTCWWRKSTLARPFWTPVTCW